MEARPTTVARFYMLKAMDGHTMQLEEGMKKHMAWHRTAGDTGAWHVWNGERASPPMIYELIAGGEGPRLAMVFGADGWGDLGPRGTPPLQALEKAFGTEQGRDIMRTAGQAIRTMETQILSYRPDLSSPAGGSASAPPQ